jgi:hypothetical protein
MMMHLDLLVAGLPIRNRIRTFYRLS